MIHYIELVQIVTTKDFLQIDPKVLILKLKNILNKGTYEIPSFYKSKEKEMLLPLSQRQIVCFSNTIINIEIESYIDAMHELKDFILDYGNWSNRKYLSLNEYRVLTVLASNFNIKISNF